VEHVHSKNYVHRDLKPENILINDESDLTSIILADFGLSASFRINTSYSLTEKMGTLLFMAPEQTKNHSYGKVRLQILDKIVSVEDRYLGYRDNHVYLN
jgi:serine/threonine protein kinase